MTSRLGTGKPLTFFYSVEERVQRKGEGGSDVYPILSPTHVSASPPPPPTGVISLGAPSLLAD